MVPAVAKDNFLLQKESFSKGFLNIITPDHSENLRYSNPFSSTFSASNSMQFKDKVEKLRPKNLSVIFQELKNTSLLNPMS